MRNLASQSVSRHAKFGAIALALAAFTTLLPSLAGAVSPEAEARFQEGKRLMAAGDFAQACARFAHSVAQNARRAVQ